MGLRVALRTGPVHRSKRGGIANIINRRPKPPPPLPLLALLVGEGRVNDETTH